MLVFRLSLIGSVVALCACTTMPTAPSHPIPSSTPAVAAPSATTAMPMQQAPASAATTIAPAAVVVAPPSQQAPTAPALAPPKPVLTYKKVTPHAVPPVAATTSKDTELNTVQISGRVELVAGSGQSIAPGELVDTLVYYVPQANMARIRPGTYTIYTVNRDFKPEAMAVPLGSTVKFTNLDQVRHNVFSVTPGTAFDLGYETNGQSVPHTFTHAGLVLIGCNVHRSMEVDVLVVPSPYMTAVAANGAFALRGLPPGPGTLHFWNPRAVPVVVSVAAPSSTIRQRLVAVNPRVPTELNAGAAP